ncbi:hypothetical protein [Salmonella enterica]|nr:hypothetical protein [Salmonella enterica]
MKRSQLTLIDGCFMFGFSLGELMNLCPDERLLFVRMISGLLRRSGGDA